MGIERGGDGHVERGGDGKRARALKEEEMELIMSSNKDALSK